MTVLALELSSAVGGIAHIGRGPETLHEFPNDRKNSAQFFEKLREVYSRTGSPNIIVVGLGPGSYAGVRIAISTAIGLQVSSDARLVGLPSICAMATEANRYHVIGDARRNSYFFSTIERHECVAGPFLCTESELREHLRSRLDDPVFATQQLAQFPEALVIYPSALELARLAINARPNAAKPPLEPIYLREPHITVPQPLKTIRTHERN